MGSAEQKERRKESQDEENHLVVNHGGDDPRSTSEQPGVDRGDRGVQGGATQGGQTHHRGSARFHEGLLWGGPLLLCCPGLHESVLSGESGAKASEAAEIAYKAAWRAGARVEPGSPCASAEASFRSSYDSGKDTVTNAALAWAKSWPGLEEGNPCSVSTTTYMQSIIGGKSIDEASLSAAKAFIGAFSKLAKSGNAVVDPSCSKAAKSFIKNSNGPDSAASDAAQAFIDATLSSGSDGYDPV